MIILNCLFILLVIFFNIFFQLHLLILFPVNQNTDPTTEAMHTKLYTKLFHTRESQTRLLLQM
jgi:hypothetical protein